VVGKARKRRRKTRFVRPVGEDRADDRGPQSAANRGGTRWAADAWGRGVGARVQSGLARAGEGIPWWAEMGGLGPTVGFNLFFYFLIVLYFHI
jgi:hypothetical protein